MKAIIPLAALVALAVMANMADSSCYGSSCYPNNPPMIAGLPDFTVAVGQTIPILDLFVYTSDLEDYNYELAFSIESQSYPGVISCTVTGNGFLQCGNALAAGYSDITVKATDTGGLSDTDTFRITVQGPANTPPMISGLPDSTIGVGEAMPSIDIFAYAFDQQDADSSLSFSIDSQSDPSVVSCTIASNRYVQCGAGQKAGFSDIVIRATDTGGLSDTDILRITVQAAPPANTAPVISGLPDFTLSAGQTIGLLDLFGYASDSQDADSALSFSIDSQSNPSVISCYVTGNRYIGCGNAQVSGYSDMTVRATDTGGLSDTDTFRITVQAVPQENRPPVVNSVVVAPSGPQDADDLTCTVQASDQDGNLDRVQFRWFVNGGLDRTRVVYVSGSSAMAQDSLLSSRSAIGDQVRCEATAYDSAGSQATGSGTVVVQMQGCGADVFNVAVVDNNKIRFSIRNTAQGQESISYQVLVDGAVVAQSSVTLASNEMEIIQAGYTFGIGSFIVKVKVTANCGAIDSESLIHQVLDPCPGQPSCPGPQPGDDNPRVDLVRISPSSPDEGDYLTCRVEVSDQDSDLDRVQMKWLVDGFTERTRTIYVNGNDDAAQDTLGSGYFNRGDEVRCDATVFDDDGNDDSDSDVVFIGGDQEGCGVDVYSLELIDDNILRFRIRNTGDDPESINYKVYLEDEVIFERNIFLDDGEWDSIEESFSFDISDSLVKVRARSDCGASDTEYLSGDGSGLCQNKYLNEYRCSGSWLQRKYQYSTCDTIWVNSELCQYGCSGSSCTGTGTGQCGVSVQRFEYQTSIVSGSSAYVTLEAKNTASRSETITLSLWVDGQLRDSYSSTVSQGMTLMRTFYYYPTTGTHQILAKAETNCGSSDTRTATVTVLQSGQPSPYPYPTPAPAPSLPTAVSIYPSSLETSLCGAGFVTIDIHNSVEQVYTIAVSGMQPDWVSYQSQNIVKAGDRQLFVYVDPEEPGTYSIRVSVTAGTESRNYQQDVAVYTTTCQTGTGEGWSITGSLIEASKSLAFWIILIIIAAAVVIIVGATRLRPDEEFYEPMYPYRRYRPLPKEK